MINRAQHKWHSYRKSNSTTSRSTPILSMPKISIIRETVQISIFAYLFGMVSLNGLHPFALSFMAANCIYRKDFVLPGLFAYLGTLTVTKSLLSLRYVGAMGLFLLICAFLKRVKRQSESLYGAAIFFSNFMTGLVFLIFRGVSPYDVFLLLIESSMTCIMAFIMVGGMPWIFKAQIQTAERNICIAVLAGIILSIARNYIFFGMNIKDILGIFYVLTMSLLDGPGAGAATGIIMGITGFSFSLSPWSTAIMAFAGLVSGSFYRLGKIGVVIGFSLGYLLYNFYVNSLGEIIIPPLVLITSYILFLFLPLKAVRVMRLYLSKPFGNQSKNFNLEERSRDRLCELASLLRDLSRAFKEPFMKNEGRVCPNKYLNSVCKEVQLTICNNCGMQRICWEKESKRTIEAFYSLIKHHEGLRDNERLPFLFRSRCGQTEEILRIVETKSKIIKGKHQMASIMKHNQELIREHFEETANMIKSLADGSWEETYDRNIKEELSERFYKLGIGVDRININYNNRKFSIDIAKPPCFNERQCNTLIPLAVSHVLGRKVNLKIIDCPLKSGNAKCHLKITSTGTFEVSVGTAGVAKEARDVSGDSFSFMEFNEGKFFLALCDGMGVGKSAARHSEKTLSLLERLLEAGYNPETALKVVNSIMISTNIGKEGFSTADIAIIDTICGRVKFIKAGAATGFMQCGKRLEMISGGSLPLGIVDEVTPRVVKKTIRSGDIIALVTDGVIDALSRGEYGEEILCGFLLEIKTNNPQKIAEEILKKAKKKNGFKDDMTVLVACIWERR